LRRCTTKVCGFIDASPPCFRVRTPRFVKYCAPYMWDIPSNRVVETSGVPLVFPEVVKRAPCGGKQQWCCLKFLRPPKSPEGGNTPDCLHKNNNASGRFNAARSAPPVSNYSENAQANFRKSSVNRILRLKDQPWYQSKPNTSFWKHLSCTPLGLLSLRNSPSIL